MRSIILAAVLAVAAGPALASDLVVPIDQTARVTLNGSAANVFVGNAGVVDALIVDRRNIVLVGRGYGKTNVMVLDAAGRTLLNQTVQVSPGNDGRMTLFRGSLANNFTCSPTCERTPMPGEQDQGAYTPYAGPYEKYRGNQTSGGGGGGGILGGGAP
jgi:hypothetical protein